MNFHPGNNTKHLFILGAGASVDYGLPPWRDLCRLMHETITKSPGQYRFGKQILEWVDKVGQEGKPYRTIDECIAAESISPEYGDDGDEIENEIFLCIKDIFSRLQVQKENSDGWIRTLNRKLLKNGKSLETQIAFVNYNYDDILERYFLDFSYLTPKERKYTHEGKLDYFSEVSVRALYPHGTFYEEGPQDTHIIKYQDTIKTGRNTNHNHMDVVSCYDSNEHVVMGDGPLTLYFLGLGGGLSINLPKLFILPPVTKIKVTVKDKKLLDESLDVLSNKFRIQVSDILVYDSCTDLVNDSF